MAKTDWKKRINFLFPCTCDLMKGHLNICLTQKRPFVLKLLREFAEEAAEMAGQRGRVYGGEVARAIRRMLPPKEK